MKVHLFKNRLNEEFKMQCGYKIHGFNIDFYETIDHTKVTCEVCKSTQAYKDLEAANESTKEILEDMEKIKDDTVAEFKQSESATYKQTVEIEIDVPVGYEFCKDNLTVRNCDRNLNLEKIADVKIFVKPKVKQGAELIGCLVGYSDESINEAELRACEYERVGVVLGYNLSQNRSYNINGEYWGYAYPVPKQKLEQLIERLEK